MSAVLSDIVVLDMAEVTQAPIAAQVLGDFGADVIKIERPGKGDLLRQMDHPAAARGEMSAYFVPPNRNKRSIVLDVKFESGRAALLKLVERADVLISNYRPGVMDRLGLGYDVLSALNPRLIYAVATGFGETGPLATRPGQDMIAQTLSGFARSGTEGDEPPQLASAPSIDFASGMVLAQGILLALIERGKSGKGQKVSTNLLDIAVAIQCSEAAAWQMYGVRANWLKRGLSIVARTRDGWVTILGFFRPDPVKLFCRALEIPDLTQTDDFATPERQIENHQKLVAIISGHTAQYTTAEVIARFEAQDVICAPVLSLAEALKHPQVVENGVVQPVPVEGQGSYDLVGNPLKLSRTGATTRRPVPKLGVHTAEVLREAGYDEAAIEALRREGALGPAA